MDTETGLKFIRLNVNMNDETAAALREIAAEKGVSYTEAVRRAITVYKFLQDEVQAGHTIQTVDKKDAHIRELVLM